jgi:hypothetical protein
MSSASAQPAKTTSRVGAALLWTLAFALAHTQAPLFFSNQNQYYLHGMAEGGHGFLDQDWLANTVDPTPVFSALIAVTERFLDMRLVTLYFAVFLGIYLHALLKVFDHVTQGATSGPLRLAGMASLVVLHSGLLRLLSVQVLGKDYPWYLQAGVAGQYILGPVFQPSVGGVLLLAAIALFLRNRTWLALACVLGAALFHATYILGGFLILGAFLVVLCREKCTREALLLAVVAMGVLGPWIVWNYLEFGPTSPESAGVAQAILVHTRIPHHAVVSRWFDWIAGVQIAWIGLAILLAYRTRLFLVMLIPYLGGAALTVVQAATNHDGLALLFPWRISAVLMPLATVYFLARLLQSGSAWLQRTPCRVWSVRVASILALTAATGGGLAITVFDLAYHMNREELALLEYVRTHKQAGDTYLLPVEMPRVGTGRGVISTSFTPPPRRGGAANLIAVDLQRFRLHTGAPIFVDFKSIPYKDVDVLKWLERMRQTEQWYKRQDWNDLQLRAELQVEGITHVVMPADRSVQSDWLECVHEDAAYRVYRLRPALAPPTRADKPATQP